MIIIIVVQCNMTAMMEASWPDLQHLVRAGLDAGRHVAGVKGQLLHLCKVVCWVPVEHQFPHWDEWEVFVGPNLKDKGENSTGQSRTSTGSTRVCPLLEDTVVIILLNTLVLLELTCHCFCCPFHQDSRCRKAVPDLKCSSFQFIKTT